MVHFDTLAANSSPVSSARILLVDDNTDMQDYVRRLLSRDYEVEAVSDGLAALDAVQQHLPDLVLIDVIMLGLDGLELLRSLRNNPATQNIPLILLSARAEEESRVEGLEAEVDDYLIKPFSGRELLARVRTNLELAQLRREAVRYQEQLRVEAQAAQTQVSNILESITDAFVAFDREWRYTYVNEYATQLLRKKRDELLGKQVWTEVFPELVGTQSYWEFHRAVTEQVSIVFEKFSELMGVWVEVNVYPSPNGLAVYFRDITHRKQAEQALRESEERFRQLTENISTVFFMSEGFNETSPGRITYVSPAYERIWGRSCESLYQNTRSWFEVVHPDDRERIQQALPGITRAEFDVEFRIVRPDGEVRWVHDRVFPVYNERGEIYRTAGIVEDITERKQAEIALQKSEEQAQLAIKVGRLGTWCYNLHTDLVELDKRMREIWGESDDAQTIPLPRVIERIHPDDRERVETAISAALDPGSSGTYEIDYRIVWNDSTQRWVSANGQVQFEGEGESRQPAGFFGTALDITDQKRTEDELRRSEQRLQLAQQVSRIGTWEWNLLTNDVSWSDGIWTLLGIEPGSINPNFESFVKFLHPDEQELVLQRVEIALAQGDDYNDEFRVIRQDGTMCWFLSKGQVIRSQDGQPERLLGINVDITDRKQAEVALRSSAERLSLALAAAKLGDWSWDAQTDLVTFSERAAEIFGIPSGPYMTWTQMRNLLHEADRERARLQVEIAIADHTDYDIEYRVIHADGTQRWVAAKGRAQFDATEQVLGMLGVVQDITDRKVAEVALLESESRFRNIADYSPIMIWMSAPDGAGVWFNQQWCEFTGQTLDEALGSGWLAAVHPEDAQLIETTCLQAHQRHEPVRLEYRLRRQDGEYRWVFDSAVARFDDSGVYLGYIGSIIDITDRKQAEAEREKLLVRAQAAREQAETANRIKDEFLAVLSHELRSPLNPILGWAKLLQSRTLDEQKTKHALATIERNAKLQTQLIEDLLDVSRILRGKLVLNAVPVSLVSTIEAAIETVRLAADAKGIKIQRILDLNVGQVMGESARLQQVIWNLLSNAVKFTPSGGTVEIRLEQINTYAQLQVKDTGKGITREFLPYLFEYFRQEDGTTTRKFGGLGLGLAIVRHLVELHGGTVWAESPGEGLGATFTVRLPLMLLPVQTPQDDSPATPFADLTGLRILVVDDEPDIRDIVAFILEQAGAVVSVATCAPEALNLMEQSLPDVLICDIGMPDIDGYMLMRQIRTLPPSQGGKILAIALTAYAGEINQQQALAAGFQMHISKPVEPEVLVRAIRQFST